MPRFRYKAALPDGKSIRGQIEAESVMAAGELLDSDGMIPLEVKPSTSVTELWRMRRGGSAWKIQDKILFTQKFASLMKAGIPLLTVLEMIAKQTGDARVRESLRQMAHAVAGGHTLHEAMSQHTGLFDRIYLGAVEAGEATGQLDSVLAQTADFLEREMNTRRQIKEAFRYPIMVIIAIILASMIILKFVVPRFLAFYSSFGSDLPLPTRILMTSADWISGVWWLIPTLGVTGWIGWRYWTQTPNGRHWRDAHLLKLPIVGHLFLKVAVSRFTRMFGVLHSAGIPTTSALNIVADGLGNVVIGHEVREIRHRLTSGGNIAEPPTDARMPDLVYDMIGIGFESGEVERMMAEVARHYDQEVDYDVRRLTEKIKPLLLIILAAGVLLLALAVLLPMWNLISLFRQ